MSVFLPVQTLPQAAVAYPCSFCWPCIAMSQMRDRNGNPICAACAENPRRRRTMPSFVVQSIKEASHD